MSGTLLNYLVSSLIKQTYRNSISKLILYLISKSGTLPILRFSIRVTHSNREGGGRERGGGLRQ
jgi:hypothetical protein